MTPEEIGHALLGMGFVRGRMSGGFAGVEGYMLKNPRVLIGISQEWVKTAHIKPYQDESDAPWPVFLKLEARWPQAANIYAKNGIAPDDTGYQQCIQSLVRMGLFPDPVQEFFEFHKPEHLDLGITVNLQALAEDLTAEAIQERLQPVIDGIQKAELYIVFAAALDSLRHEQAMKAAELDLLKKS